MTLKKIAICAAALVAATVASHIALAGGKGGVSATTPGHLPPPSGKATEPGKSANAPGDKMHDSTTATNAKEFAPGDANSKKK
jgi:hypothetical protein